MDARTDGCFEVARAAAKPVLHLAYSLHDNPLQRAAPSRVKHPHGTPLGVHQNHRQAICGLDREQKAGSCREQSIARQGIVAGGVNAVGVNAVNDIRMNLTQCDDGPQSRVAVAPAFPLADRADFMQEHLSIAFDGALRVVPGEAEVQITLPVCAGESSDARGKTVDQPGKFAQVLSAENVEFGLLVCFFVGSPSRHGLMLQEREIQTLSGFSR